MAPPPHTLHRATFTTSRLLEYFSEKELTLQTGHEPDRWPEVLPKELVDNALDAAEDAGTPPEVAETITPQALTVEDNGPGIPPTTVAGLLDFNVRTSSKDAYISPSRGQQGNALKTVLAIPYVASGGVKGAVTIETQGTAHQIVVTVDKIAQAPDLAHGTTAICKEPGTRVTVQWPDSAFAHSWTGPRQILPDSYKWSRRTRSSIRMPRSR